MKLLSKKFYKLVEQGTRSIKLIFLYIATLSKTNVVFKNDI